MSFITAALIGGGVALVGGYLSSQAAGDAASQQAGAANNATQTQLQMFNTQNNQQAPYRQAGYSSLAALLKGLGLSSGGQFDSNGSPAAARTAPTRDQFTHTTPGSYTTAPTNAAAGQQPQNQQVFTPGGTTFDQAGYDQALNAFNSQPAATNMPQTGGAPISGIGDGQFTHQFNAGDLNANLAPNYEFQLQQGLGAAKNAGNLQTGLLSGNTLKGVQDYAQNYASGAYQQAYNNYNANQSNIFNRLSNIAGLGQTANQATGTAAVQTGQNVGNSQMAAGAAQAAGTVGQANAITGAANNALGWYSLSQMMKPGGSV